MGWGRLGEIVPRTYTVRESGDGKPGARRSDRLVGEVPERLRDRGAVAALAGREPKVLARKQADPRVERRGGHGRESLRHGTCGGGGARRPPGPPWPAPAPRV